MAKPSFDMMWKLFPDHQRYPSLKVLFEAIGGELPKNIDLPGFGPDGNTCAVRMSFALNYGNHALNAQVIRQHKLRTMTGGDKLRYLFRVRELRIYLENALGVTPKIVKKDFGNAFESKRGIVAFRVDGWQTASGHIALWDGTAFKEPKFDDYRGQTDDPSTPDNEGTTVEMALWEL